MYRISPAIKLFFLLFIPISTVSSQTDWSISSIPAELLKNANAVVRNYVEVVTFKSQTQIVQEVTTVISILNSDAEYHFRHIVDYKGSSEKVKINSFIVYDAAGKQIKKIKRKNIMDIADYDGMSLISDQRSKIISFQALDYPLTVEYSYTKTKRNTLHIPPFYPLSFYNVSVQYQSYQLINQTDIKIASKNYHFDGFDIERKSDYHFEIKNCKARKQESYSPEFSDIFPHSFFRPHNFNYESHKGNFRSWRDYGNWVNEAFLEKQNTLKDIDVPSELSEVYSANITDEEKVRRVYKYIQENTRYILINLKDGGLKPMKSGDVNQLKYGDCKALSYYMYCLLQKANIPVKYGIVYASSQHQLSMDESFPNPFQANHIIINVPLENNDIWLDCTSTTNPFNYLGSFTDNRKVLLIDDKEIIIKKTPDYAQDLNRLVISTVINLEKQSAEIEKVNYGLKMHSPLYYSKLDKKDRDQKIIKDYFSEAKGVSISNYNFEENKSALTSKENIEINSKYLSEDVSNYKLVNINLYSFSIPTLPKNSKRLTPVSIVRSSVQEETIHVTVPVDFSISPEENTVEINSVFGNYLQEMDLSEGILTINRKLVINQGKYSVDQYQEIRSFFKEIKDTTKKQIALKK